MTFKLVDVKLGYCSLVHAQFLNDLNDSSLTLSSSSPLNLKDGERKIEPELKKAKSREALSENVS